MTTLFEKIANPDASVVLKYKEKIFKPNVMDILVAIFAFFVLFPLGLFSGFATSGTRGGMNWFVMIAVMFIPMIVLRILVNRTAEIKILPNQEIQFKGKVLPIANIQTLGKTDYFTRNGLSNSAVINAVSNGVEHQLTGYVKQNVAAALVDEIEKSSGIDWK